MQLVQFDTLAGERRVGLLDGDHLQAVSGIDSVYELAARAIDAGRSLAAQVRHQRLDDALQDSVTELLAEGRVRPPLEHPEPARCLISGTGLTHTGSASTRDAMHQAEADTATDSMKMFAWGVEGGCPEPGAVGVQPEWFYKGNGRIVARPGGALPAPAFGLDFGEEPEIAGLYLIGNNGRPYRLGYALGNEASDHVTERQNYLYLAHSKLRACAFGPALVTDPLPRAVDGTSRIRRGGEIMWDKPFQSGEAHMCHSLANLEYHHFKYDAFRTPGDVHVHFFGTATLSFAGGVETRPGDVFEISADAFGPALCNTIERAPSRFRLGSVTPL